MKKKKKTTDLKQHQPKARTPVKNYEQRESCVHFDHAWSSMEVGNRLKNQEQQKQILQLSNFSIYVYITNV